MASYSAAYLLVGRAYPVLKKWKTRRGAFFDRRVFAATPELRAAWAATGAGAVIPVPQRFERSWRLSGSPSLAIARWVARAVGVPVLPCLAFAHGVKGRRQATLARDARFTNPLRFEAVGPGPRTPVLLVDDFTTTGHTLRAAARALKTTGTGPVHAFCLGTRPEFVMRGKTSDGGVALVEGLAG